MASSDERRPNYGRRFFWFAVAIVAVISLYSAGWHYVGGLAVERVNATVASFNRDGRRASCENAEARGYPFRIGVFCRSVMFEDARGGIGFRARQLRSAAQVYQPMRVIGELDGPATLEAPGLNALELRWSSLRTSVRLASPLPERVSVEGRDVVVRLDEPGVDPPPLGEAGTVELHMRPFVDGVEGLDLALRFSDLRFNANLIGTDALPPLAGLADVALSGRGASLRGRDAMIRTLALSIDEATGATISGPLSVDTSGLIDADLQVTLRNPLALGDLLGELFPDARREIRMSLSALAAMGEAPALPLRIRQGEVSLGFLSLGSIPPL